ncbi:family 20 glycosylhydrolase [Nocardia albiluteola]|uniref:family 20 glycosylhydrolase n=1 Tax=Nocardia albiluteola TaxID=2842303 RepID=UPI0027E036A0|nr:family 20 glycosylhydrolase [Nocardia albiluteola]
MLVGEFERAEHDLARMANGEAASIILSPSSFAYLDRRYAEQPRTTSAVWSRLGHPGQEARTIRQSWEWDPAAIAAGHAIDIAGVEAAVWAETITDFADLGRLLLPRLPGVADRAWSLDSAVSWENYRAALAGHSRWWRHRGWQYFDSSLVPWT